MSGLFDTTRNFSLYAIPVAWALAMAPHAYAIKQSKAFDIRAPRGYIAALEKDQTIDKATKDRIIRCEGAQSNGFENLGLFASAVVAGNVAGLPAETLNILSGGYLISRVVYNIVYISNSSETLGNFRTVVWLTGVAQALTLFIKSGNVLRNRAANLL